jgi:hypothetical protein
MTMNWNEGLRQLKARLTPDIRAAVESILKAKPDVTMDEAIALLQAHFPEVYEKNRPVLEEISQLRTGKA